MHALRQRYVYTHASKRPRCAWALALSPPPVAANECGGVLQERVASAAGIDLPRKQTRAAPAKPPSSLSASGAESEAAADGAAESTGENCDERAAAGKRVDDVGELGAGADNGEQDCEAGSENAGDDDLASDAPSSNKQTRGGASATAAQDEEQAETNADDGGSEPTPSAPAVLTLQEAQAVQDGSVLLAKLGQAASDSFYGLVCLRPCHHACLIDGLVPSPHIRQMLVVFACALGGGDASSERAAAERQLRR